MRSIAIAVLGLLTIGSNALSISHNDGSLPQGKATATLVYGS
jgi:hypothetical protein